MYDTSFIKGIVQKSNLACLLLSLEVSNARIDKLAECGVSAPS